MQEFEITYGGALIDPYIGLFWRVIKPAIKMKTVYGLLHLDKDRIRSSILLKLKQSSGSWQPSYGRDGYFETMGDQSHLLTTTKCNFAGSNSSIKNEDHIRSSFGMKTEDCGIWSSFLTMDIRLTMRALQKNTP